MPIEEQNPVARRSEREGEREKLLLSVMLRMREIGRRRSGWTRVGFLEWKAWGLIEFSIPLKNSVEKRKQGENSGENVFKVEVHRC